VDVLASYLLVDGYNIINSWEELKEIQKYSLEDARDKLMELIENYRAYKGIKAILVFDAHLVKGSKEKHLTYGGLEVVYTKENQIADEYIEKFVDEYGKLYYITVATSDWLEQQVVLGRGAVRISSRELKREVYKAKKAMKERYKLSKIPKIDNLEDRIDKNILEELEKMRREP
jgi:hypothetical protein